MLLSCWMLAACESLVAKGDKLYEEGMYEQAAAFYEKALAQNPNNADAALGLVRSRDKIVDRGLIEVRMLRLSSNERGAAMKLETLLGKQAAWNAKSTGAMWVTQQEEIDYAEHWLRRRAAELAGTDYPDRFRWFQHLFPLLIANAGLESELARYAPTLRAAGWKKCAAIAERVGGQRFFLKAFSEKYCMAWERSIALDVDAIDRSRYQAIELSSQLRLVPPNQPHQQSAFDVGVPELERQFRESPWYSARGGLALVLAVDGLAEFKRAAEPVRRRKSYTVVVRRRDPDDKDETIKVREARTHYYDAVLYRERYRAELGYRGQLGGQPLDQRVGGVHDNTTESHDDSFPAADLAPQRPQFMNTGSLLRSYIGQLAEAFAADLQRIWQQRYCERDVAGEGGRMCCAAGG